MPAGNHRHAYAFLVVGPDGKSVEKMFYALDLRAASKLATAWATARNLTLYVGPTT
jgi:hypothetical protein